MDVAGGESVTNRDALLGFFLQRARVLHMNLMKCLYICGVFFTDERIKKKCMYDT